VVNAGLPDASQYCCGYSYCTLDRNFRVVAAGLGWSYWPLQPALEAEHRVTAGPRFREPAVFYPVRRGNSSGWEVIPSPGRPLVRWRELMGAAGPGPPPAAASVLPRAPASPTPS
jgi:hypothetical protein